MLDFSDIKLGKVIIFQDKPCVVTACYFSKVTKGKPTKKCKIKNLITGLSMDYTFKAGERIEEADLRKEKANYLYASDGSLSFMTVESYETVEIEAEMLGGKEGYLKDGLEAPKKEEAASPPPTDSEEDQVKPKAVCFKLAWIRWDPRWNLKNYTTSIRLIPSGVCWMFTSRALVAAHRLF